MISNNETKNADASSSSRPRSEVLKSEQVNLIAAKNGLVPLLKDDDGAGGMESKHDGGGGLDIDISDEADNSEPEFVYREGGIRAWLVVIASGYCFGILVGLLNDYSLIYNQMIKDFNGTENHVLYAASIGSISTGLQFLLCPIGSFVADLYGPRKSGIIGGTLSAIGLFLSAIFENLKLHILSYGVIFGLGQAFLLAATLAILPHYFNKRLSFANGLMNFVAAVVVIVLPVLMGALLRNVGLKATFFFLSSVNAITVLAAFLYKPILPLAKGKLKDKVRESFGLEIFKRRGYVVWCVASLIGMFGYLIPLVCIGHFSEQRFPDDKPEILNVAFGVASAFGALIFGKIGDKAKFARVHFHTGLFVVYGLVLIAIPFTTHFYVLVAHSAILGFMDGVLLCFIVPISYDLSGSSSKLANQAAAYYHAISGPTAILGPPFSGYFYEKFKTYDIAFFTGGATCIVCSLILIIFIGVFDMVKKKRALKKALASRLEKKVNGSF